MSNTPVFDDLLKKHPLLDYLKYLPFREIGYTSTGVVYAAPVGTSPSMTMNIPSDPRDVLSETTKRGAFPRHRSTEEYQLSGSLRASDEEIASWYKPNWKQDGES